MLTGIDHIVIAVNDLFAASTAFHTAGFTVTPGGSHPTGTHNALIPFEDGSYLELIAVQDADLAQDHPWFKRMDGKQGFVTFALGSTALDDDLQRFATVGIQAVDRKDGARTRPDGQQLQWQSAALQTDPPVVLPFLIQDVTDRALRVEIGEASMHPNGARGTTGLTLVTGDLQQATVPYGALFSAPVAALDHGFEGVQQAWRYFLHEYWMDLVQAPDSGTPLADYHATFGDSIYQILLTVSTGPEFPARRLDIPGFPDLHILVTD